MASQRSSRRNSQAAGASTRSSSISSQSASSSSSAASSNSSTSKASSRPASVISVGSQVIGDLLSDHVRHAATPDGAPTGALWGERRDSWNSCTSHNSVEATPTRLKARHYTVATYRRKMTPHLQATLQSLAPEDKLGGRMLHLRHTPKTSDKAVDDLRYFSSADVAQFHRTLSKHNRISDTDGHVADQLKLLPGTKDEYRIMSTRKCNNDLRLGDESLFRSIEDPKTFVRKVRKAIPKILATDEAGFNGRGIDGLKAGVVSRSNHFIKRKPNATTYKQESQDIHGHPAFHLDSSETYDLAEDDEPYGLKSATVKQTWGRGNGPFGEEYEESLENTGSKVVRSTEHTALCKEPNAGAVLIRNMRSAHNNRKRTSASRKNKNRGAKAA